MCLASAYCDTKKYQRPVHSGIGAAKLANLTLVHTLRGGLPLSCMAEILFRRHYHGLLHVESRSQRLFLRPQTNPRPNPAHLHHTHSRAAIKRAHL